MNPLRGWLVFGILSGLTGAFDIPSNLSCLEECNVSGQQKFFHIPFNTYTYTYTGKSSILVNDVPDAEANMEWAMDVNLHWISPCEFYMLLKNPVVKGMGDEGKLDFLTGEALIVNMNEGSVKGLCASLEEDHTSLNLKKGIVTALQNSLPSLSVLHSGKTYTELDVIGMCPTQYTVKKQGSKYFVAKSKNHLDCSQTTAKPSDTLASLLLSKFHASIQSSSSKCVQEIQNGVILSVTCEDASKFRATSTGSNLIRSRQVSKLVFKGKHMFGALSVQPMDFRKTTLAFEQRISNPSNPNASTGYQLLHELCHYDEGQEQNSLANITSHLVEVLEGISVEGLVNIFQDIKSNKSCPQFRHVKTIFMDILAFLDHEGSLKIMIDEILNGDLSGMRNQLYIASLFLRGAPSSGTIKYFIPAFETSVPPSSLLLAIGDLVHKYCERSSECYKLPSIQKIWRNLSKMLISCSKSYRSDLAKEKALLVLKTIGNMGNINSVLMSEIFYCIRDRAVPSILRVAGIESFRRMTCNREFVDGLLKLTLQANETTEVRIAAYLQVMRCPSLPSVKKIVELLRTEDNTNVVSFIRSHLVNVVSTHFPFEGKLKQILGGIKLPKRSFASATRQASIGYYAHSINAGILAESNVIQDTEYQLQKRDSTLYLAIFNKVYEAIEISLRLDNDPISRFQRGKAFDVLNFDHLTDFTKALLLNFLSLDRQGGNDSLSGQGERKTEWDIFMRMFATEVINFSKKYPSIPNNFGPKVLEIMNFLLNSFQLEDLNSLRAFDMESKLFIPTIQGIPILLKLEATSVAGWKIVKDSSKLFNQEENSFNAHFVIKPTFSFEAQSFIGFSLGPKAGIRAKFSINLGQNLIARITPISRDSTLRISFRTHNSDLDLWKVMHHIYLFKKIPGKKDLMISPKTLVSQPRLTHRSCIPDSFNFLGSRLCWNLDSVDLPKTKSYFSVTPSSFTVYLELKKVGTKNFVLDSSLILDPQISRLNLNISSHGLNSHEKRIIDFELTYSRHYQSFQIHTSREDGSLPRGLRLMMEERNDEVSTQKTISMFYTQSKNYLHEDMVSYMTLRRSSNLTEDTTIQFEMKTLNKLYSLINVDIKGKIFVETEWYQSAYEQWSVGSSDTSSHQPTVNRLYRFLKWSLGIPQESLERPFASEFLPSFPLKVTVEDMEIMLGSGDFQMSSFLHCLSSSANKKASEYRFLTAIRGGRSLADAKVTLDIAFKHLRGRSIVLISELRGELGVSHVYQSRSEFSSDLRKTLFTWEIEDSSRNSTITRMKFSRISRGWATVDLLTEAEFVMFGRTPHYAVTGTSGEVKTGVHELTYSLKREDVNILNIIYTTSTETDKRMNMTKLIVEKGSHTIAAGYTTSERRLMALMELKNASALQIGLEASIDHPDRGETYATYQMSLPRMVDVHLGVQSKLDLMKTNFTLEFYPEMAKQRLVQGHIMAYYDLKKLQGKLITKGNGTEKRVTFDADYDVSLEKNSLHLTGDLQVLSEKYSYALDLSLGSFEEISQPRHLIFNFTSPAKQRFFLHLFHHNKVFRRGVGDVTDRLRLITPRGGRRSIESNFCYFLGQSSKVDEIAGQVNISLPQLSDAVIKMALSTCLSAPPKQRQFKVWEEYFPEMMNSVGVPVDEEHLSTEPIERSLLKDFKLRIESTTPSKILRNITFGLEKNETASRFGFFLFKNSEQLLNLSFNCSNDVACLCQIQVPSGNLNIGANINFLDSTLTFYPNKGWQDSVRAGIGPRENDSQYIYEVDATMKLLEDSEVLSGSSPEKEVFVPKLIPQISSSGRVEMNWNTSNHTDKILVSLESLALTRSSRITDIVLWSQCFKSNPRIFAESCSSPSLTSLTFTVEPDIFMPPSLSASTTLSSLTNEQTNFFAFLETHSRKLELVGTINNYRTTSLTDHFCSLPFLNGTLKLSEHDTVDFAFVFHPPCYVQVAVSKYGSPFTYVAHLGGHKEDLLLGVGKELHKSVGDVCLLQESGEEIAMASAHFKKLALLELDGYYNIPRLREFQKHFLDELEISHSLASQLIAELWNEVILRVIGRNSSQSTSHLRRAYKNIITRGEKIFKGVKKEEWFSKLYKSATDLKLIGINIGLTFRNLTKGLINEFSDTIFEIYDDISNRFGETDQTIKLWIQSLIESVRSLPEYLPKQEDFEVLEMIVKYLRASKLWKLLKEIFSSFYSLLEDEILIIWSFLQSVQELWSEGVDHIWNSIRMSSLSIDRLLESFSDWTHETDSFSLNLLKSIFRISVTKDEGQIKIKLPLMKSSNSLWSVLNQIGIPRQVPLVYV